mmetsp:Transcript_43758/g.133153  ORF Transcript_43758/g.133153 Transcript_43758/m.133153 type:complete len:201 (-) Transcript_43758:383-985(-)
MCSQPMTRTWTAQWLWPTGEDWRSICGAGPRAVASPTRHRPRRRRHRSKTTFSAADGRGCGCSRPARHWSGRTSRAAARHRMSRFGPWRWCGWTAADFQIHIPCYPFPPPERSARSELSPWAIARCPVPSVLAPLQKRRYQQETSIRWHLPPLSARERCRTPPRPLQPANYSGRSWSIHQRTADSSIRSTRTSFARPRPP